MRDDTRVEKSKFETGPARPSLESSDFPWGYGENRITAIVRDPDSAYLYWEITDEAIASATDRLGPEGRQSWCCLRVYDTTGREFDGTNANDYFDIRVDRADREFFLMIRRPTSTMHAEIGMKSSEGYFQPIARSGRAEFPRSAPSTNTTLDWMTVTSSDPPPAVAPYRSRYGGPELTLPPRAGAGYVDVWRAAYAPSMPQDPSRRHENASSSGAGVHRTLDRSAQIERWWHLDEWRSEWRGGLRFTRRLGVAGDESTTGRWHEGPFPADLTDPERIAMDLLGEAPVHLFAEGMEFTVYGPWRVTIRSFELEPKRRILATWSMRWVSAQTPLIERWGLGLERSVLSGYEREHVVVGASERLALLERGASELWRMGASERMWLGASEWVAAGASETLFLGASQVAFAGASGFAYAGASERMGASEKHGASEVWRVGGASSPRGGASETNERTAFKVGASGEKWGGRLEEV